MNHATPTRTRTDPTFRREDARGLFLEVINRGPWETVIAGSMREGAVLGHHYHRRTEMFLFLTSGAARIDLVNVTTREKMTITIHRHEGLHLPSRHAHAVRFLEPSDFILLKSRPYCEDDPDTYPFPVD